LNQWALGFTPYGQRIRQGDLILSCAFFRVFYSFFSVPLVYFTNKSKSYFASLPTTPIFTPLKVAQYPTLGSYIAGLIEGDGCIKVPSTAISLSGKLRYPAITIAFAYKDKPLSDKLAKLLGGYVNQGEGNYWVLSIQNLLGVHNIALLVNGKFRTPKINELHRLITWLNKYGNGEGKLSFIEPLGLEVESLGSNAWLTGMLEADSNFMFSYTISKISGKLIGLGVYMRLTQQKVRPIPNNHSVYLDLSSYSIMNQIALFLSVELKEYFRIRPCRILEKGYSIRCRSLLSRTLLINSLTEFPLLSSKRLDYISWKEVHLLSKNKGYKTSEGQARIIELKGSINNSRTVFDWSHLDLII
jgi:LAGLIDADG endonuclease